MNKILSIAWNTFVKSIRQPVFSLVSLAIIPAIVISVPLCICRTMNTKFSESDQRMLANLGISSIQILSFFLALICASTTISGEIRDKTALTVISKPTSRWQFVVGKYLGVQLAVTLGFYIGMVVLLMAVRHQVTSYSSMPMDWPAITISICAFFIGLMGAAFANYFFRWNFCSSMMISFAVTFTIAIIIIFFVGRDWSAAAIEDSFGPNKISFQLGKAILVIYLSVLIITAFAVAASTRLGQLQNLLICCLFFAVGVMHEWSIGRLSDLMSGSFVVNIFDAVLPNLNIFEPYDAMAKQWEIPSALIGKLVLYTASYTAALVIVGILLFQGRELVGKTSLQTGPETVTILCGLLKLYAVGAVIAAFASFSTGSGWTGLVFPGLYIVSASIFWLLSIGILNGRRWAWWLVLIPAVLELIRDASILILPRHTRSLQAGMSDSGVIAISAAAAGLCILLLVIPKTRHYFKSLSSECVA